MIDQFRAQIAQLRPAPMNQQLPHRRCQPLVARRLHLLDDFLQPALIDAQRNDDVKVCGRVAAELAALRRQPFIDADRPAPHAPGAALRPHQHPAIAAEQDAVGAVGDFSVAVGAPRWKEQVQPGPHAGVGAAPQPPAHARRNVAELWKTPEHSGCKLRLALVTSTG